MAILCGLGVASTLWPGSGQYSVAWEWPVLCTLWPESGYSGQIMAPLMAGTLHSVAWDWLVLCCWRGVCLERKH